MENEGYHIVRAYSGTEALLLLNAQKPDLILLDLMLPGLSGEELLPKLSGIPVIVVSAKSTVDDKVQLLLHGAADYITKPFDTRELLARILVQFRDSSKKPETILTFSDIAMDTRAPLVSVLGKPVHLTKTEYAILKLLLQNQGQVITKSTILERISEDTPDCVRRSGALALNSGTKNKSLRFLYGLLYRFLNLCLVDYGHQQLKGDFLWNMY